MFLDNLDPNSQDSVTVARQTPAENKAYKLNLKHLPKITNNGSYQHLLQGLSPTRVNDRHDSFVLANERSPRNGEDKHEHRGPKVLSKNLPEVFISNSTNPSKVRKVSGIRPRVRGLALESESFTGAISRVVHTEAGTDPKEYGTPTSFVVHTTRHKESSQKSSFDNRPYLKGLANLKDADRRLSTAESPRGAQSFHEGYFRGPIGQQPAAERVKTAKDEPPKSNMLANITNEVAESPGLKINSLANFFGNKLGGKQIQVETKLGYNLNLNQSRSATNKQLSSFNYDVSRKSSITPKQTRIVNFGDHAESFLKELSRVSSRDTDGVSSAGLPRHEDNGLISNGSIKSLKKINKNDDPSKQTKKLVIFKRLVSRSPTEANLERSTDERIVKLVNKEFKPALIPAVRLNELITLKKVKTTHNKGSLKRMLHAPTFMIYDLQEEFISELESKEIIQIKGKLNDWRNNFANSAYLQRIHACFWNSPEGCVSVLLESSKSGLLTDLTSEYGSLPEQCIKILTSDVLRGIVEIHKKTQKPHGHVSTIEIITESNGNFKLGPGICQTFASISQQHKYSQHHEEVALSTVQKPRSNDSRQPIEQPSILKDSLPQDIFDFGFMLLQAALGDLSIYDSSNALTLENLKNLLNSKHLKKHAHNACCLLHHEELVRRLLMSPNGQLNNIAATKKKVGNKEIVIRNLQGLGQKDQEGAPAGLYIPLIEALTMGGQFSEGFIDFLCCCLNLDETQRLKGEDLLGHRFLMEGYKCGGPAISIKEFLRMKAKDDKPAKNVLISESDDQLDKFSEALGVVLLNKDVQEKFEEIMKKETSQDKRINELAAELVVSPKMLWGKIKICLNNLEAQP